jgi:hypothetical protein
MGNWDRRNLGSHEPHRVGNGNSPANMIVLSSGLASVLFGNLGAACAFDVAHYGAYSLQEFA